MALMNTKGKGSIKIIIINNYKYFYKLLHKLGNVSLFEYIAKNVVK
jgi:hypothetical protein